MMEKHYENKFAYFRISNQIVFIEVKDDVVLDLDAAAAITADRLQFQEDVSYLVLFDVNGISDTDKAGRDYMAQYGWFLAKRVGILANAFKARTIAKFYLAMSKPKVVTEIFNDENTALHFLQRCTD
jgi:hypothetical protein